MGDMWPIPRFMVPRTRKQTGDDFFFWSVEFEKLVKETNGYFRLIDVEESDKAALNHFAGNLQTI